MADEVAEIKFVGRGELDLPRLIYHRRALSNELLLRALTGTSFFTIRGESKIQSFPRLGGLHHRYKVAA